MTDVTRILSKIEEGNPHAAEELLPLVYAELRRLAARKLANEKAGQTLDATGLVHEAYLRLVARGPTTENQNHHWDGRGHFFAAAAEAMRRILVENARRKHRLKRGGEFQRVATGELEDPADAPAEDILAVDEALDLLATADAQAAQVVKLHFFAGLSFDEVAALLGISVRSAYRDWAFARAWLARWLGGDKG
jgi:RNA polymerase sigma factor (TIGR02999 family)